MANLVVSRSTIGDFIIILPAIVIAWIVIDIWKEVLYGIATYFGLQKSSIMDMVFLGTIITIFLVLYLWWADKDIKDNLGDISLGVPSS